MECFKLVYMNMAEEWGEFNILTGHILGMHAWSTIYLYHKKLKGFMSQQVWSEEYSSVLKSHTQRTKTKILHPRLASYDDVSIWTKNIWADIIYWLKEPCKVYTNGKGLYEKLLKIIYYILLGI